MAELWRTNRAWQSTLMVVRQEAVAVVENVLRDGIANGELSDEIDIPLTASALVGMVLVAALDWQAFQPERSLDDVHAALSRLLQGRVSGDVAPTPERVEAPVRSGRVPRGPRRTGASSCSPVFPRTPRWFPRSGLPRVPPCLAPAEFLGGRSGQGRCTVPPPRVGGTGAAPLSVPPLSRSRRSAPIRARTQLTP